MHPLLFAFIPLIGWGLGDFFIQRTTRRYGTIATLWFISMGSTLALAPWMIGKIPLYSLSQYGGLLMLSFVIFVYAIVLFKAFDEGKLSVTEAVVSLELPITVGISVFAHGETLTPVQAILFMLICVGIFLSATKHLHHFKHIRSYVEKGVYLALVGSVLSAFTNYYVGITSEQIDPFFVIYVTHAFLAILCTCILIVNGTFGNALSAVFVRPHVVIPAVFFDNMAWFGYAFVTATMPISLTVMVSESYIVLAALLGYLYGHETLKSHQKIGALIALPCTVLLSYFA